MSQAQRDMPIESIQQAIIENIGSSDDGDLLEIEGEIFNYENQGNGEIVVEAWDNDVRVRALVLQLSVTLTSDVLDEIEEE